MLQLQQHLPFTVLKLGDPKYAYKTELTSVATAPTVHGIET